MLQDVSIWLYSLSKCGYYSWRGPENRAPIFSGISQTLVAIENWTNGKLLGQTATYGSTEGDEHPESYLLDIHRGAHGDYLVAIWNRLPGNRHHVSSVGIGDVVGSASAEITEIDRNRIPGFATYFWVLPAEQRIATIGLKHQSHSLINFGNYFSGFLKFIYPEHVVLGPAAPDGSTTIEGYRMDITQAAYPNGVRPTFSVKSIAIPGEITYLRQNVGSISRVICKTVVTTSEPGQRNWLQTMLNVSRIAKSAPANIVEAPIRVEFPVTLTLAELNSSIDQWAVDMTADGSNDMGFKFHNGQIKWLRKSHARESQLLDVQWIDDELVDLAALLSQLQVHRTRVLALG